MRQRYNFRNTKQNSTKLDKQLHYLHSSINYSEIPRVIDNTTYLSYQCMNINYIAHKISIALIAKCDTNKIIYVFTVYFTRDLLQNMLK